MVSFLDLVERINLFDKERESDIKDREVIQEEIEGMFSQYMTCLYLGMSSFVVSYANMIKLDNEIVLPFLDLRIKTLEENSNKLKELVVKKASPEELEKGLIEVEKSMRELNDKCLELLEKMPK